MFYGIRQRRQRRRFERQIAGILTTAPPLTLAPGPCTVVSMVADWDVSMYLLALKSLYPKLGGGAVVAIVARSMPQAARDQLMAHVPGIELVALEEIDTGRCQRGGTWERLLFILDRTTSSYVIQMDADILCVADDIDEVVACVRENRSFAISDGFGLQRLAEAASMAEATPSDYVGIVTERAFAAYPEGERLRYVRASSGFAGFAKGGFSRLQIERFHSVMESLVGSKRWRDWGTEQCASNFAIANSLDPAILPNPQYGSFTPRTVRSQAKLLHFIGTFRFDDGFFARCAADVIAQLSPGDVGERPGAIDVLAVLARLSASSLLPFLRWLADPRRGALIVRFKQQPGFRGDKRDGARVILRNVGDLAAAHRTFAGLSLMPPMWIPPERVRNVADLAAGAGVASAWFLANYWRASVTALSHEPDRALATMASNGMADRFALIGERQNPFSALADRTIDIARIPARAEVLDWLERQSSAALAIGVIVIEPASPRADRLSARFQRRLRTLGYTTYAGSTGTLWGYRDQPWSGPGNAAIEPSAALVAA